MNIYPIHTPLGVVQLVWSDVDHMRVQRIWLPEDQRAPVFQPIAASQCPATIVQLGKRIQRFLRGEPIRFKLSLVDLAGCSPFQRAVLQAEHAIPRGMVSTYGLIAKHVCSAKAARAVGRALATNPFPLVIPCHRAIRSNGELGGFQGGLAIKRALLEMEGHHFDAQDRLVAPRTYYA